MNDIDKKVEEFESRGEIVPSKAPESDSFLATIERLAARPDIDPDKIKQFMDMNELILDRNAKQAFNSAMVQAQSKIKLVVAKIDNTQTGSKYADLTAVLLEAKPIYTREGFALMFYEGETGKENHKRVGVDIMHEQGHTEKRYGEFAIQTTGIAGKPMMTQIHGEGSAFKYGRRYLTCMIFNIPTGDDDNGNAVGGIEYITEEQVKIIELLAEETNSDVLKWQKINSLSEILAGDFKKVEAGLRDKLKDKKKPMREPGMEG